MNKLLVAAVAVCMLGLWGCASQQGGPVGSDQGFKIVVPMFPVSVKQGETESAKITVDRGKHFKQDVKVALTASEGISIKPTEATVKAGDKGEIPILVTAPKDAAIGEYKINVKGTPETGDPVAIPLKVKVSAP